MKKDSLLFLVLVAMCSYCYGQKVKPSRQTPVPSASGEIKKSLLWEVSGKNLSRPSYIFGTMHLLCEEDAVLSDSLEYVIKNVDDIYLEVDMSDMTQMMSAMKYMRMRDNKKLSDFLTVSEYQKVKDYFFRHTAAIPFRYLEYFKPMVVASLIEAQNMPCTQTQYVLTKIGRAS